MTRPGIEPDLRERIMAVLKRVGLAVAAKAMESLAREAAGELARPAAETRGDTIYALDVAVEEAVLPVLERGLAPITSFVLVAEGLAEEPLAFPAGRPEAAAIKVIIDPVDGTRGLMHDKRSAWFLAGAAPNLGAGTALEDIEAAVQVEIPGTRARLQDILTAAKGEGARGTTRDLATGEERRFRPAPTGAATIRGGFATIARFFPPAREALAALDDELARRVLGEPAGRPLVFEDQYISTGGQLHQLLTGRDRFVADLRALAYAKLGVPGLACHPYDLAASLIAREAGVVLCAVPSGRLEAALDTTTPVAWVGYGNQAIRSEVEPPLIDILEERGWLAPAEARALRNMP